MWFHTDLLLAYSASADNPLVYIRSWLVDPSDFARHVQVLLMPVLALDCAMFCENRAKKWRGWRCS
jgi:hypothetical protein